MSVTLTVVHHPYNFILCLLLLMVPPYIIGSEWSVINDNNSNNAANPTKLVYLGDSTLNGIVCEPVTEWTDNFTFFC